MASCGLRLTPSDMAFGGCAQPFWGPLPTADSLGPAPAPFLPFPSFFSIFFSLRTDTEEKGEAPPIGRLRLQSGEAMPMGCQGGSHI